MPYRYLDDIAIADVAFEAWGVSLEEMFAASADALLNVMLTDPEALGREEELVVELAENDLEMLLFEFLNELVFLKDSRRLLLRSPTLSIGRQGDRYTLRADLCGDRADHCGYFLGTDVKAVTMHRFRIEQTEGKWTSTVVLDI
jgi:SHS2 domain-containing protein